MTVFQFCVLSLRTDGTRAETIATALGTTEGHLGNIMRGDRSLSDAMVDKASAVFKVPRYLLRFRLDIAIVRRLARLELKCRR